MSTDGSNKYANLKVTVKQPVTSVKLNKKSVALRVKGNAKQKTVTLKAKVYPNNANNKTVKWSTSKSEVVHFSFLLVALAGVTVAFTVVLLPLFNVTDFLFKATFVILFTVGLVGCTIGSAFTSI